MTRKLNIFLLALLVLVAGPFAWLMLNASTVRIDVKPVTIVQLRGLAASVPGSEPTEARYEVVGRRRFVSDLLAAGSGLRPVPFILRAYELVAPGRRAIAIDRGMSRQLAEEHHLSDFDPRAQAAVEQATRDAATALVLAPSVQHGGATTRSGSGRAGGMPDASGQPYAVARGVVVIPAYGVRHGTRMVYARLSDGQELLFTGDVAPVHASWEQQRPPARLVTTFFVDDDREEIAAWLRTIRQLKAEAPGLHIVTGHDAVIPRIMTRGFLPDPARSGAVHR